MNNSQYLIEYFNQLPILIKIIWVLTCVLFILNITLIIHLKFHRNHLRRIKRRDLKYQKKYEALLITYLYAGNEGEDISAEQQSIIDQLKIEITDIFKRGIAVSILLKLMEEITGDIAESIQRLYIQAGFLEATLNNIKSNKWHIVAKGIRELTLFEVKEVHDAVLTQKNHPKKEVRKEVQLYEVNLFNFKGLEYLNELKEPLSEWDQIQLLEILQRFENQEIPSIVPWLKSSNNSVVIFALKLAKIYNQFETSNVLIELLSHENEKIRVQTITVLDHLYVSEAKNILKKSFNKRTITEQIAFFKMLENLCDSDDESFLIEHVQHADFEIKLGALKLLKLINIDKFNSQKNRVSEDVYGEIIEFIENN